MTTDLSSRQNILQWGALANPYPGYAELQEEAPLYRIEANASNSFWPHGNIWFVTQYDDAVTILRDSERFVQSLFNALPAETVAQFPPLPPFMEIMNKAMLFRSPADHARLRGLVNKAFTPRTVQRLEPRIHAIANALIDRVESQGKMELVTDYAYPLPLTIIAEMLGIPEADQAQFRAWVDDFMPAGMTPEAIERTNNSMMSFWDYASDLVRERRKQPQDDLTTALVRAEEAGDQLSEDELVITIIQLIVAGHETSARLIANGVVILLGKREQWEQLVNDATLIESMVEELLRYESSGHVIERWAAADVEMHGQTIRRGDRIMVMVAAANRDDQKYRCPHTFNTDQGDKSHLAFGQGIHYCLGAPLARLETQIALNTLAHRLPHIGLSVPSAELSWFYNAPIRSLQSVPLKWQSSNSF